MVVIVQDLQALMIFLKVLETGSFTDAGLELGIAKSSVSKKISALEQELGVRLIQRSTRKLRVTEEGKALYERCLRIRAELEAAERELSAYQERPQGVVRVSAPPLFANSRLAGLLPAFLARYPDLKIELHLTEKLSDLISGGFDLSIRTGELSDSSLVAQRLCEHQSLLCAAPAYLEAYGRPEHPDDIASHNYLAWQPPDRSAYSQLIFHRGARNYRAKLSGNFTSTDAMAVRDAAVNGGGITMLPDFAIHELLRTGLLVHLLPDYEIHTFPLSLVYPQHKQVPAKVRVLADYLRESLGDF